MRVVFLDHVARLSGAEIGMLRLIAAADEVDAVVLLAEDGPLVAAVVHMPGCVRAVARRLRELDPDLVHTMSLKAGIYGTFAARLARLPVVWHLHHRLTADYLPRPAVGLLRVLARTLPSALAPPRSGSMRTSARCEPRRGRSASRTGWSSPGSSPTSPASCSGWTSWCTPRSCPSRSASP
jgi:hypothetical protein